MMNVELYSDYGLFYKISSLTLNNFKKTILQDDIIFSYVITDKNDIQKVIRRFVKYGYLSGRCFFLDEFVKKIIIK